jgi:hypothetical protein
LVAGGAFAEPLGAFVATVAAKEGSLCFTHEDKDKGGEVINSNR